MFNFVDNHDVERIASILNVKADLPLIYAMLMTMPGIPCLYYGSEWGMEGKKNWNDTALRPAVEALEWNELTDWIHTLIDIHHALRPLYEGSYRQVALTNTACVYARELDGETVWTAINLDDSPVDLGVDFQAECVDWLADSQPVFVDWCVQIPAKGAMILTKNRDL